MGTWDDVRRIVHYGALPYIVLTVALWVSLLSQ